MAKVIIVDPKGVCVIATITSKGCFSHTRGGYQHLKKFGWRNQSYREQAAKGRAAKIPYSEIAEIKALYGYSDAEARQFIRETTGMLS